MSGKEEKRLAEERGSYHDGVPAIFVVVDGGWSKRSHKHSYNANSGVGIIVGKATGKLLHIGVRNRFCTACSRNIPKEAHDYFKNWMPLRQKWRSTSLWKDSLKQKGYMDSVLLNLLVMVTVLSTLRLSRKYQVGVMQFASLNVQTTALNVTGARWRSWSKTTHPIRVKVV